MTAQQSAAVCVCGHARGTHHGPTGPCLAVAPSAGSVCACVAYRPRAGQQS